MNVETIIKDITDSRAYMIGYEDGFNDWRKQHEVVEEVLNREYNRGYKNGYSYGIKADRPQGEWKPKNHHTDYCSLCGFEETQWRTTEYKFCPNCGCQMKEVDDESI